MSVRVLLVRHGAAVGHASSDAARWLTDQGRAETVRVAGLLRQQGVVPSRVFTSPLVRAVQTAEVFTQHLTTEAGAPLVEVHVPLSCHEGTAGEALSILARARPDETVMLVTHMPKVRALAGTLTGRGSFAPFPTTGVCCVSMPIGSVGSTGASGVFEWVLSPRLEAPSSSF